MSSTEIQLLEELIFKPLELTLSNVKKELESQEYLAHVFQLNGQNIKFRRAKITPTKTGQFVTIWKRNKDGITTPFSSSDEIEFYIIVAQKDKLFGTFIFPKSVLHKNKILSDNIKEGKRGIRVYPPWYSVTSKQAQKTQEWQTKYFVDLSDENKIDLKKVKDIL